MKNAVRVTMASVAGLFLAAAVWGLPRSTHSSATLPNAVQTQAPQTQTVSGTIASVEKTSFTLNVASQQPSPKAHAEATQSNNMKTMTFQIDKNTTIDGGLKVGANADVTYRQDASGNNVAINVHVTS